MITDYITAKELADSAGLQYKTLWTYRKRGILPEPEFYVGNKPLWSKSTIDQWMSDRRVLPSNRVRQD